MKTLSYNEIVGIETFIEETLDFSEHTAYEDTPTLQDEHFGGFDAYSDFDDVELNYE